MKQTLLPKRDFRIQHWWVWFYPHKHSPESQAKLLCFHSKILVRMSTQCVPEINTYGVPVDKKIRCHGCSKHVTHCRDASLLWHFLPCFNGDLLARNFVGSQNWDGSENLKMGVCTFFSLSNMSYVFETIWVMFAPDVMIITTPS